MITEREATTIAGELASFKRPPGEEPVILRERTITRSYGWIFTYDSRRFLETGDFMFQLGGNAPLLVLRLDGSCYFLGTGKPMGVLISDFEKEHGDLGE